MNREIRIGKIIKGIGGFYYVAADNGIIYETKARGLFRKEGLRPLVGDDCEVEVPAGSDKDGSIISILPRRSVLIRPAVANTDQAIIIFAVSRPEPHTGLIDRILVGMEYRNMPVILVFNKADQDPERGRELTELYRRAGYPVILCSAKTGEGTDELKERLSGKTSAFSGPSGVGKSSLLNLLFPEYSVKTGGISEKIGRGKHTTRHSELMVAGENTYILDTPGFSSLELPEKMEEDELDGCFPDFRQYLGSCRFNSCRHMAEPDCGIKAAAEKGDLLQSRYESYTGMMEELKRRRRYS